jgi:CheY-like chemotaxis protein
MADPQSNEIIKRIVSDRLKQIDLLLKGRKVNEAHEEIREIRQMDPTNPYARAFEERILEIKAKELEAAIMRAELAAAAQASLHAKESDETLQEREPEPEPIPREEILPAQTFTAQPFECKPADSTVPPPPPPRKRRSKALVVLVDDNAELLEETAAMLEDYGMTAAAFSTTDEAYIFLEGNYADLIICDVHLETSSFGGFTFYDKMRTLHHLQDVPFLFLSGLTDARLVYAGKELGADDYLKKPIDPEELMAVIRGKLRRFRQLRKK